MPFLWQVKSGRLVEKAQPFAWDWLIDGRTPSASDEEELVAVDTEKRGEIFYAAANGKSDKVAELLASDKKLVRAVDDSEYLPIRYAAENGRTKVVEVLLENKSPIVDGWGELSSVLMTAATNGHFETLKGLMPKKPKGPTQRWHCSWAASEALNENYEDIANYLLDFKPDVQFSGLSKKQVVLDKISRGYPELGFSLMNQFGIDPTFDVNGVTALHSVAGYADASLLEKVHSLGIDPRTVASDGSEPLDFALGFGNVDAICWFIEGRGEELDGKELARSFAHAIAKGRKSSIECLLGYGYSANVEIQGGVSAVVFAVVRRKFDIASLLIANGAVMDPASKYSPLVVSRLIEGDQVELLTSFGEQSLDWGQRLWGALSIRSAAEAVGAEKILAYLEREQIDAGESGEAFSLQDLDEKPRLLTPLVVDYSDELRAQFGSRSESVEIVISSSGEPLFVIPENEDLPEELFEVIVDTIENLRFSPGTIGDSAVPVVLRSKLPLKADFELAKVFNITDVDEKPSAIKIIPPTYPYSMRLSRTRGEVVVEFTLMPNGKVRDIRPYKSTHKEFEKSALASVLYSVWEPAKKNGKPVACRVRIPIKFSP